VRYHFKTPSEEPFCRTQMANFSWKGDISNSTSNVQYSKQDMSRLS